MIKGMTGFGYSVVSKKQYKITVEVKSVNHRYLDISYYLPNGYGSIEEKIKQCVKQDVSRGRLNISIKFTEKPSSTVKLNKQVVEGYSKHINALQKQLKLNNDVQLSDILRLPGVFDVHDTMISPKEIMPDLEKAIKKALTALVTMRKREGRTLQKDLSFQLRDMQSLTKKIKLREKAILKEKKSKLTDEEFSSLQKSIDINEEIKRLTHYIDELKLLLKLKEPVGKRIDFMAQEMQREANTTGSKIQDKVISNAVISLKSCIEKIREQAQNVE